jgi:hypothetical protein
MVRGLFATIAATARDHLVDFDWFVHGGLSLYALNFSSLTDRKDLQVPPANATDLFQSPAWGTRPADLMSVAFAWDPLLSNENGVRNALIAYGPDFLLVAFDYWEVGNHDIERKIVADARGLCEHGQRGEKGDLDAPAVLGHGWRESGGACAALLRGARPEPPVSVPVHAG